MPVVSLSLPVAIGLLALFLTIGAVMVFLALRQKPEVIIPVTPTATATQTVTPSPTGTELPPTSTSTPEPTPTPLTYKVVANDNCGLLANRFDVSINSIILMNNLGANCTLTIGADLLIPQPTPTATSPPTSTMSAQDSTQAACKTDTYVVQDGDTPSGIAKGYGVPWQVIKEENGLTSDTVFAGSKLVIPLCKKTAPLGPTSTPTLPPPYPAPNLLLPPDGAFFTLSDNSVTLQWASVGTLKENEAYAVTVVDVTEGQGRKLVDYVTDTKFVVPSTFRMNDTTPHDYRWTVMAVRQTGSNADGSPIWDSAGNISAPRDFIWSGASQSVTPTP